MPEDWLRNAVGAVEQVFPELRPQMRMYRDEKCRSCASRWAGAVWPRLLELSKGRNILPLKGIMPDDLYLRLGGGK